jgi:adenylate cyclase class 2
LLRGRRLQEDALLDTPDDALRQRRCALRVRTESGRSFVTFKGPVQPGTMKVREEIETAVGDGDVLLQVFEQLGFRVWFRYEKYREEYAGDGLVIAIDETPVGTFVELEGGEAAIQAMTHALGRTEADYVLDSYRGLFLQHQQKYGYETPHMFFLDDDE